jgi:hypothetical protein
LTEFKFAHNIIDDLQIARMENRMSKWFDHDSDMAARLRNLAYKSEAKKFEWLHYSRSVRCSHTVRVKRGGMSCATV